MRVFLLVLTVVLSGCLSQDDEAMQQSDGLLLRDEGDVRALSESDESQKGAGQKIRYPVHSVGELLDIELEAGSFTIGRVLAENEIYTRHYITYASEGLTISGIMNIPKSTPENPGPWPVLFLNHGYIDPAVYTNGRGLKREQDYFARQGFVVVHSDYRGHAQSDANPVGEDLLGESGYTRDVLGGVVALQKLDPDFALTDRVGMLGHSMGGGVTMKALVARPDLIDAAVLYAPVSSDYLDNLNRWMLNRISSQELAKITLSDGSYDRDVAALYSVKTYFDRVGAPVVIHHGNEDKDVPVQWSKDTLNCLKNQEKEVVYHEYPGEGHEFGPQWNLFMERSRDFFRAELY